jgi:ribosomal protein S18 acetylase RimI-like enzyme
MMIEIAPAQSGQALADFLALAQEYVSWLLTEVALNLPHLDRTEFVAQHLYDDLGRKFPGEHVPPDGCLLIARRDGQSCGCAALGRLGQDVGEMRTLFVQPASRGAGAGRKLAEACLDQAQQLGYRAIRLDTLEFMDGAQALYRLMGFREIEPYLELSPALQQHIRFFERGL